MIASFDNGVSSITGVAGAASLALSFLPPSFLGASLEKNRMFCLVRVLKEGTIIFEIDKYMLINYLCSIDMNQIMEQNQ